MAGFDLAFDHFLRRIEGDGVDPPELPFAGMAENSSAVSRGPVYSPALALVRRHSNGSTMKDDKGKRESRPARNSRQDRLKLALRENLKRRKAQARGRSDANATPRDDADASPHDELGKKPGE